MIGVKEIIIHRFYHEKITDLAHCGRAHETVGICVNDVALLVLDAFVSCQYMILLPWSQSTVSVASRRFPSPIDWTNRSECHVAGWGFTSIVGKKLLSLVTEKISNLVLGKIFSHS